MLLVGLQTNKLGYGELEVLLTVKCPQKELELAQLKWLAEVKQNLSDKLETLGMPVLKWEMMQENQRRDCVYMSTVWGPAYLQPIPDEPGRYCYNKYATEFQLQEWTYIGQQDCG